MLLLKTGEFFYFLLIAFLSVFKIKRDCLCMFSFGSDAHSTTLRLQYSLAYSSKSTDSQYPHHLRNLNSHHANAID